MRSFCAVLALCAGLTSACQSTPAELPAQAQPPYTTTATVKDLMLHVIDPAGDAVWNSVATIIDKEGLKETAPKTDEDWMQVRHGVITLIEASNLLMIPGRAMAKPGEKSIAPGVELEPAEMEELVKKDPAGWIKRAQGLHEVSLKVLSLVDAKDAQGLFDIGEELDQACENCHRQYWFPNEVIPDVPKTEASPTPAK